MRLDEEAAPATAPATVPATVPATAPAPGSAAGKRAVRSTRPPELDPVLSADYHPSPALEGGDLLALRAGGAELFFCLLPVALGYSLPPPSVAPLAARLTAVLRSLGERCIARRAEVQRRLLLAVLRARAAPPPEERDRHPNPNPEPEPEP